MEEHPLRTQNFLKEMPFADHIGSLCSALAYAARPLKIQHCPGVSPGDVPKNTRYAPGYHPVALPFDRPHLTSIQMPFYVGPTSDAEGYFAMDILDTDLDNIVAFGACKTRSLSQWVEELTENKDCFFTKRPKFVSDVGFDLMRGREAAGMRRSHLSARTGLARGTILEIESGRKLYGSALDKIATYLQGIDGRLTFMLTHRDTGQKLYLPFRASDDAAGFAARFTRTMRTVAGLTQVQLNERIRLLRALNDPGFSAAAFRESASSAAPRVSKIEAGTQKHGIRLGTMFAIAYFCHFELGVVTPQSALA